MIEIALKPVANQSFTIILDGSRYLVALKEANGTMAADVVRDNVVVVTGARVVGGTPILPYRYLQIGNFILLTENEALPYYTEFGVTQSLLYLSPEEIEVLRST